MFLTSVPSKVSLKDEMKHVINYTANNEMTPNLLKTAELVFRVDHPPVTTYCLPNYQMSREQVQFIILLALLASLAADNTACVTPTGRWHAELVSFRCVYGDTLLPMPSLYVMRCSHLVTGQNGGFFCPTHCRPCGRHCCYLWLVLSPILGPAPCVHCVCPRSGNHREPLGSVASTSVHLSGKLHKSTR